MNEYKMKQCKHDWVRILNIQEQRIWYLIIYGKEYTREEKYICLKCGEERK